MGDVLSWHNSFLSCTQAQRHDSISHDGEGFGKIEVGRQGGNRQNIPKDDDRFQIMGYWPE